MKQIQVKIIMLGIGVIVFGILFLVVSANLIAQDDRKTTSNESKASKTVRDYWALAEKGKFGSASKLTTTTRKGFTYTVHNSPGTIEEVIYNTKLKFVRIEQVKTVDQDEVEVAVRVKNRFGNEVFKFHTVVKDGKNWKIFSTSY